MNGGGGRLVIKNRIVRIWTSPNEKDIQNKKSLIIFARDCRLSLREITKLPQFNETITTHAMWIF